MRCATLLLLFPLLTFCSTPSPVSSGDAATSNSQNIVSQEFNIRENDSKGTTRRISKNTQNKRSKKRDKLQPTPEIGKEEDAAPLKSSTFERKPDSPTSSQEKDNDISSFDLNSLLSSDEECVDIVPEHSHILNHINSHYGILFLYAFQSFNTKLVTDVQYKDNSTFLGRAQHSSAEDRHLLTVWLHTIQTCGTFSAFLREAVDKAHLSLTLLFPNATLPTNDHELFKFIEAQKLPDGKTIRDILYHSFEGLEKHADIDSNCKEHVEHLQRHLSKDYMDKTPSTSQSDQPLQANYSINTTPVATISSLNSICNLSKEQKGSEPVFDSKGNLTDKAMELFIKVRPSKTTCNENMALDFEHWLKSYQDEIHNVTPEEYEEYKAGKYEDVVVLTEQELEDDIHMQIINSLHMNDAEKSMYNEQSPESLIEELPTKDLSTIVFESPSTQTEDKEAPKNSSNDALYGTFVAVIVVVVVGACVAVPVIVIAVISRSRIVKQQTGN